ncbi:MAG TPA: hypothetical protein VF103_10545 [Polyangiaceae bacterium]
MIHRAFTGLLLMTALAASGCYHYRVTPANSVPADDGHSTTQHAIAWGLVQPRAEAPNCQGNGAAEFTAHTNFGFVLLSVVTLGFWVPVTVEWKCSKDRVVPGHGMD